MEQDSKQKQANIRLALLLAAVALGILVAFMWVTASGGGPA
jgi:flagellar basal body-associated protein FliL